jgi:hypothetical protein
MALAFPCLCSIHQFLSDANIFRALEEQHKIATGDSSLEESLHVQNRVKEYLLQRVCRRFENLPTDILVVSLLHPGLQKLDYMTPNKVKEAEEFILHEMERKSEVLVEGSFLSKL